MGFMAFATNYQLFTNVYGYKILLFKLYGHKNFIYGCKKYLIYGCKCWHIAKFIQIAGFVQLRSLMT